MKKIVFSMIVLSVLTACQSKKEKPENITSVTELPEVQELFRNDANELFIYKNNTFELVEIENNTSHITKGNVNYERGFEEDNDATLYVLNFDKPSEERYFVRYSKNDSTIFPLNGQKKKNSAPTLYRKR